MVFCNNEIKDDELFFSGVTILILIDGFLQLNEPIKEEEYGIVTILILIDGFLQYIVELHLKLSDLSHNPYFNRWFSAIKKF